MLRITINGKLCRNEFPVPQKLLGGVVGKTADPQDVQGFPCPWRAASARPARFLFVLDETRPYGARWAGRCDLFR
ncbi:hypothetical protein ACFLQ0_04100 [Nitrospinota bacterium]